MDKATDKVFVFVAMGLMAFMTGFGLGYIVKDTMTIEEAAFERREERQMEKFRQWHGSLSQSA